MSKRTDKHAPSTFDPAKYTYEGVVALAIPKEVEFLMLEVPEAAAELRADWLADRKALDARVAAGGYKGNFVNKGTCDHCGAWFLYGAEFHHEDGDVIVVGHTCAEEAFGHSDRVSYDVSRTAKIVKGRKIRMKKLIEAKAFIKAHGLADVFCDKTINHESKSGKILSDMHDRLINWGSLSEKQIAFAKKLADEIHNPPTAACRFCGGEHDVKECPRRHPFPVTGERIEIRGTVISAFWRDHDYGSSLTGIVLTEDGYRVRTTIAAALIDAIRAESPEGDLVSLVRGRAVSFEAKVKPSDKDVFYGFANRPSKAVLLDPAELRFNPGPEAEVDADLRAALESAREGN